MDVYIDDEDLEKLFQGIKLKGKPVFQESVVRNFIKAVEQLSRASRMEDLWNHKGLNFKALQGDKSGLYSVRVTINYRLEFSLERILEGDRFVKDVIHILCMSNHYS